jgi:peptidoglycan biosynthesis protein MviN/MurJ (putative lipid II flippase)
VLAFALVGRYDVLGLGLAFAISYLVCAAWTLLIISYKVPGFPVGAIMRRLAPIVLASIVMAEVVWLVTQRFGSTAGAGAFMRVAVGAALGVAIYLGLLLVLQVEELDALRRRFARR